MAVYKLTPTKANLIKSKNSLQFAKKGYELLDRKRTVLIREMMSLIDKARDLQERIDIEFKEAYEALKLANITVGAEAVEEIAISIEKEKDFHILFKSVMGVEVPVIKGEDTTFTTEYGFFRTNPAFDKAVLQFNDIKKLIYELAELENSVYKLAMEIKKTQKRANALEKIQIPKYTSTIKYIEEVLEEKEREDFFRLKKVKGK
ncbi:V/A-type H+-transporting ATPase subunit D [Tissierella praeacuta DSM 18095]|uniref:V-type ATP synthase subunit D n=1 Tax=Tissierella praeacuta DSM 18095 TaxID=1123404 RepID=A0A1M4VRZ1_9FIRM|nr:V-type ATP synthase subunit D [Tissierella praeacuta]SHE71572.1 V/A-type H+-transporting ATPase subunit D [Tissierella praeacuta DSM 18095]SUO98941.1 V-ATPase subunit D [Tissierella praeacuta]